MLPWLISQTIFLVEIRVRSVEGDIDPASSVNALGFSAQGIVSVLVLSFVMLLYPILLGFQRYPAGAPIVSSNSLALSAACHSRPGKLDEDQHLLKYGYIGEDDYGNRLIGFSSGRVASLVES